MSRAARNRTDAPPRAGRDQPRPYDGLEPSTRSHRRSGCRVARAESRGRSPSTSGEHAVDDDVDGEAESFVDLPGDKGWSPIRAGLTLTPMVVGMILGMVGSSALVKRLGRHLIHVGVLLVAAGAVALAVTLTGVPSASSWDLVPGLFFVGVGVGASLGQLFQFILTSVNMREVGSAAGVMEASQQLSTTLSVAVLGTIYFATFKHHLPTDALRVTALVCLVPLGAAFAFVFGLPMHPRAERGKISEERSPTAGRGAVC